MKQVCINEVNNLDKQSTVFCSFVVLLLSPALFHTGRAKAHFVSAYNTALLQRLLLFCALLHVLTRI